MQKELIIAIVIGLLLLVVIVQVLQVNSLNANIANANTLRATLASTASTGTINTAGWTANEKMNYEMHGTIPARFSSSQSVATQAQSSVPQQVGGC